MCVLVFENNNEIFILIRMETKGNKRILTDCYVLVDLWFDEYRHYYRDSYSLKPGSQICKGPWYKWNKSYRFFESLPSLDLGVSNDGNSVDSHIRV